MAGITDLICKTADGKLSFGNFDLDSKQKRSDFPFEGDLYKVKTFKEITKLERNGMFVYESVPGTVVTDMSATEQEVTFKVGKIHQSHWNLSRRWNMQLRSLEQTLAR